MLSISSYTSCTSLDAWKEIEKLLEAGESQGYATASLNLTRTLFYRTSPCYRCFQRFGQNRSETT
jgi:hypothetical protein